MVKVDGDRNSQKVAWRVVRGHDKRIHGSCAIYFPSGITDCNFLTSQLPAVSGVSDRGGAMGVRKTQGEKDDLSKEEESSIHIPKIREIPTNSLMKDLII